jgi:hypothetical protein
MAYKFNPFTGEFDEVGNSVGGASTWGSIGGTLSNQTDLQNALNSKAPALGGDDNYVTDAEKTKLANTSGTNSGDQDLSSYLTAPKVLSLISIRM